MSRYYTVTDKVVIDGVQVPCLSWSVTVGLAGNIGTARIKTTRNLLKNSGLRLADLREKGRAARVEIECTAKNKDSRLLFGGVYDRAVTTFKNDQITINCLDYAALLVGTQTALSDINTTEQTPSDIAKQIARKYDFVARVTDSPADATGKPLKAGRVVRGIASFTPSPTEPWRILQDLAKLIDFDCYVTPSKELVFAPPDPNQEQKIYTWKAPVSDREAVPIIDLEIEDSPRRNTNFRVLVFSYDTENQKVNKSEAIMVNQDIVKQSGPTSQSGRTLFGNISATVTGPGLYSGAAAAKVKKDLGENFAEMPTFVTRVNSLTPEQMKKRAESLAKAITKRGIIATLVVEGDPTLQPQQPLLLREGEDGCLDDYGEKNMEVASITHNYNGTGQFFDTTIHALHLPAGTTDVTTTEDPSGNSSLPSLGGGTTGGAGGAAPGGAPAVINGGSLAGGGGASPVRFSGGPTNPVITSSSSRSLGGS